MKRGRGQRVGLSRAQVLEAALALVDRDGLAALSMRRLGAELGVEAMTIHHHVQGKEALLDGLVERLLLTAADSSVPDGSWETTVRDLAHGWLAALRAHPALLPVVLSRPAVTTANLDVMEATVGRLHDAGFPLARALDMLHAVAGFVVGQAAGGLVPAADEQVGVLADTELGGHPLLARAARSASQDPVDRFEFALEAMLRGFAATLDD